MHNACTVSGLCVRGHAGWGWLPSSCTCQFSYAPVPDHPVTLPSCCSAVCAVVYPRSSHHSLPDLVCSPFWFISAHPRVFQPHPAFWTLLSVLYTLSAPPPYTTPARFTSLLPALPSLTYFTENFHSPSCRLFTMSRGSDLCLGPKCIL